MAYQMSEHMMNDIAADLASGATFADLADQYGMPAETLKRVYLRKSREVYGK